MADSLRKVHAVISRSPLLDHAARSGWGVLQKSIAPSKRQRYLQSTDCVRLMLGAGPCARPGWLATDITPSRRDVMYVDARARFPFADNSVDLIHSEHLIEHITFDDGRRMLSECIRILRPGGRLRLSTPDYDRVLALAREPLEPELLELVRADNLRNGVPEDKLSEPVFAVNRLFSDYGHRFLYTEKLLTQALEEAGLAEVRRHPAGHSEVPDLCGLEMHGDRIGREWNEFQSLILEGVKRQAAQVPLPRRAISTGEQDVLSPAGVAAWGVAARAVAAR